MKSKFVLTDQGELEHYLGEESSIIDENTLLLRQTGYAKKVLERFNMTDCKEDSFTARFKSQLEGLSR